MSKYAAKILPCWQGVGVKGPPDLSSRPRRLDNYDLVNGRWQRRKGVRPLSFAHTLSISEVGEFTLKGPLGGSKAKGTLVHEALHPDGTRFFLLATAAGKLYRADPDPAGGEWDYTLISDGMGAATISACQIERYTILTSLEFSPKYYDGTTFGDVPGVTNIRAALVLNSMRRVVLGHILTSDHTLLPYQIRMSNAFNSNDIADITWDDKADGTGNVHFQNLPGKRPLTALADSGDGVRDILAFNDDYLVLVRATGDAYAAFETTAPGCVGPNAWTETENGLVYLSKSGPMYYNGGGTSEPLANETWWPLTDEHGAGMFQAVPAASEALVTWNPLNGRVWFTLPRASGGRMEQGRIFCYWPRAGRQEWSEYIGFWPTAAALGRTEDNREAIVFLDDYGHPFEADYGYLDAGFRYAVPMTKLTRTVVVTGATGNFTVGGYISNTTKGETHAVVYSWAADSGTLVITDVEENWEYGDVVYQTITGFGGTVSYSEISGAQLRFPDAVYDLEADALAGKFCLILPRTENPEFYAQPLIRISGNDARSGDTMEIRFEPGQSLAPWYELTLGVDGDALAVGAYASIVETGVFDLGQPAQQKIFGEVALYQQASGTDGQGLLIFPRFDFEKRTVDTDGAYAEYDRTVTETTANSILRMNDSTTWGHAGPDFAPLIVRYLTSGEGLYESLIIVYLGFVTTVGGGSGVEIYHQLLSEPFFISHIRPEGYVFEESGAFVGHG